jgi:hypothetical protein
LTTEKFSNYILLQVPADKNKRCATGADGLFTSIQKFSNLLRVKTKRVNTGMTYDLKFNLFPIKSMLIIFCVPIVEIAQ